MSQTPTPEEKYVAEKRCCTICDRKKLCHVCKQPTLLACSDCRIDFATTIYVCGNSECRDRHERKCYARVMERLRARPLYERTCECGDFESDHQGGGPCGVCCQSSRGGDGCEHFRQAGFEKLTDVQKGII